MLSYRFRLYPTEQQDKMLSKTMETCRRLYNRLLDERINTRIDFFEQKRQLTTLRKTDKYLRTIHSQVMQDVALRLDRTFQSFFAGLGRFPKFKRKGRYYSFTYPQMGGFQINNSRMRFSMIGSIKVRFHRPIEGRMKTCTIVRDVDQWFACITVEVQKEIPTTKAKPPVGVDLGILSLATLSDGTIIPNHKYLKRSIQTIKELQRQQSRKAKGSHNREKAKIKLAKAWRKVRRQRNDAEHKASHYLAERYSTIVFENSEHRWDGEEP